MSKTEYKVCCLHKAELLQLDFTQFPSLACCGNKKTQLT